jgi:hypothetical protein
MTNQLQDDWSEMIEQMNEAVADSVEQNMEAQASLMESWTAAMDESALEEDEMADGIEGFSNAYEVWMDTAEQMFERTTAAAEGEDVDPTEFRDLWLESANEAFSEVMSTSAFASANGQLVEAIMEMQQDVDEVTQESLARMGMATRDDVVEVGERLVELERRQHDVEKKLDRVLDALEE